MVTLTDFGTLSRASLSADPLRSDGRLVLLTPRELRFISSNEVCDQPHIQLLEIMRGQAEGTPFVVEADSIRDRKTSEELIDQRIIPLGLMRWLIKAKSLCFEVNNKGQADGPAYNAVMIQPTFKALGRPNVVHVHNWDVFRTTVERGKAWPVGASAPVASPSP